MSKKRQPRGRRYDLDDEARVLVRALAARYPDGFVLEAHEHAWSQLLYASSGVMRVETDLGFWIVPPNRSVWLPARFRHRITMSGPVAMRTLYFPSPSDTMHPTLDTTRVLEVSPLLRELIIAAALRGKLERDIAHDAHIAALILALLHDVGTAPLELPMPRDARALRVAERIRAHPGIGDKTSSLARAAGASPRTLERLFQSETGLTLGRWRQQARLLEALTRLAAGDPVGAVADHVGYATASAFVAMFRAALGTTPRRYFAPRT
jgi:AraC-like DNA-binding protein